MVERALTGADFESIAHQDSVTPVVLFELAEADETCNRLVHALA